MFPTTYGLLTLDTDRTIEIIQQEFFNVSIIQNEWLGFADQRNLIKNQKLKHSTILFLDADEELARTSQ